MTISSSTISAIQKTGAAAFIASEKLKKEADNYAKRVREALNENPFDLNNDALIENWKSVAKLVQTLTGMEGELRNIHHIASNLATEESEIQPTHKVLSLLAPAATTATATTTATTASKNQDAVDVTPKKSKRVKEAAKKAAKAAGKRVAKAATSAATTPAAPVNQTVTTKPVTNADKLFDHLAKTLNADTYTEVDLKALTEATGIPMGSIHAAIKKVIELGKVNTDGNGGYKLTA